MKTTPSVPATTRLQRLIDWLTKENETTPKHAGMFTGEPGEMISDDGGYGDVSVDDQTPDFVRKDNEGWVPLR